DGSKTGRDGILVATMSSAEFSDDSEEKRPTVQVGDPFTEKLLIEACLELMQTDCIVAIQDMGAAGLTSSSFEMASKGGMGVELDLDQVPQREENMTAYEIMLSESQERMLMVLRPGSEDQARAIFEKWELDFAIVGTLTDTGRMVLMHGGEKVADLPIDPLALASPEYDEQERPWTPTPKPAQIDAESVPAPNDPLAALSKLMGAPDMASKRWIWEQYDHMVMGDTLGHGRPGGDAALVRVHGTEKALAIATDCTPRYCKADPVEGGKQAVAEVWRNITATGAKPLAITDCMNFGNPEKPEIMGQFVGAIEGMRDACNALEFPVVSGNVSLYNETNGQAVLPTPAIGGVGLIENADASVGLALPDDGLALVLIGETRGHLGQSMYLREIEGREDGAPPPVDLAAERRNGDFVRARIDAGQAAACHDLSDGGLLAAASEMALAGGIGVELDAAAAGALPLHAFLFGEDQARYLIATRDADALLAAAAEAGVPAATVGESGGASVRVAGFELALAELRATHEGWLPEFMGLA
ncbi:MAG: phosphoribosylformylglycinamidine synthase subunit PurL, partial [Rhodospirillaceae bacterium]|nr:phosphoribosylformylglycinamidine synthase subunit PurL [Rhodospirillaceae bacterium]